MRLTNSQSHCSEKILSVVCPDGIELARSALLHIKVTSSQLRGLELFEKLPESRHYFEAFPEPI